MDWILDTNILLRLMEPLHVLHPMALGAIHRLLSDNAQLAVLPQNVAEFWNVCTRPLDKNGLGFTPAQADAQLSKLETFIDVIPDTASIYPLWRKMVAAHGVSGVQVHDTRIAAAMQIHGIERLLTFNSKDFKRFQTIRATTPDQILNSHPTP